MKKILLLTFLIAITSSVFAQKTYTLQFKPKEGEKFDAVTSMKSIIKQTAMGQEMVTEMAYDVNMLYDVKKAGANTALNMVYEKLSMEMNMMGQNMKLSSEDDDSNPLSKNFKTLKGSEISVIVSPNGDIIDVKGTEAISEKFKDLSAEEQESLKTFIGKQNLKSMMEQSFKIFPNKPVKTGESWTSTFNLESPYRMTSINTYKLKKVENGIVYLDVIGGISTNGVQKMSMNGIEVDVDLEGDQKGTMELDEATGTVKNSVINQVLKGKIEVMGQEIPMDVLSDINVKMIKK